MLDVILFDPKVQCCVSRQAMPRLCLARNHRGDTSCSVWFGEDQLRMQPAFEHLVNMGTDASASPPEKSAPSMVRARSPLGLSKHAGSFANSEQI